MQVSVETLKGLERKITVSVPSEKIEEEVSTRLKELARKAKIDGFRAGRVPLNIVKQRYGQSVRHEVARDMVQSTLFEALKEQDLNPAGFPEIEPEEIESGKDFRYAAMFEVFPEFSIDELGQEEVELIQAKVKDSDVDDMIQKLREQDQSFEEVERAIAEKDKAIIDFEGFIAKEAFEGGQANDYEIVVGSGSMIKGFEEGLIGAKPGEDLEVKVTFPKDYGHEDLAGKKATFKVHVKKVLAGKLPELDDAFAEKYNIKEGGVEALKKDIKQNMERELERQVGSKNRESVFDKLMQKNEFDIPKALIDQEINNLKHEMYHRIFGAEHHENEKIPDFPRDMFEAQAKRRVHLGLLFSEYVKKHEIKTEQERVDAMIEKFASAYEDPDELRNWYRGNKERMAEVEALVMEELVSEKILQDAKVKKKTLKYEEVMNPKEGK